MLELNDKLEKAIDRHYQKIKDLCDYITDNPELGGQERLASQAYRELLEREGFQVELNHKGVDNSFLAIKKSRLDYDGPRGVLMCEYDALPDVGHACGHSISGGASLLAALAVHEAFSELPIRIDIMGTPGEEYPGGKEMLAKKDAFSGYEFAAMAHMFDGNSPEFKVLACNDRYITFKGKSSHASAEPEKGINAMNAARLYMEAMDMWRQHIPKNSQFHGIIVNGGELPSIVPDKIELNYYYRAVNLEELEKLCTISENCCRAAALATGCSYTSEQQYLTYADLYSTPTGRGLIKNIFELMGEEYTCSDTPQGSTDAGNADYHIPVFHPLINVAPQGEHIPVHSPEFAALMKSQSGYRGLRNAAVLLSNLVLQLAENPKALRNIQAEHREYRGLG